MPETSFIKGVFMRFLGLALVVGCVACGSDGGSSSSSTLDVSSLAITPGVCLKGVCPIFFKAEFTSGRDLPDSKVFVFSGAIGEVAPEGCAADAVLAGRTGAWTADAPAGFTLSFRGCVKDNDDNSLSPGATATVTTSP